MPELLDLRRQGAAAALVGARAAGAQRLPGDGQQEARPVHRGIAPRAIRVEQVLVLDLQQGAHQQRRDRRGRPERLLRKLRLVQGCAAAVQQAQAGLGLLGVDGIAAGPRPAAQDRRRPRLRRHHPAACPQRGDEVRQAGIAQALVVGSGGREAEVRAGARAHGAAHAARQRRQQQRAEQRGVQFRREQGAERDAAGQRHRRAMGAQQAQLRDGPCAAFQQARHHRGELIRGAGRAQLGQQRRQGHQGQAPAFQPWPPFRHSCLLRFPA